MKNKLNFYLFALFMLISTASFAQIRYGVKGGVNLSRIKNFNTESESRTNFHIGGLAKIPIGNTDQFYFQPEIFYQGIGEKNGAKAGDESFKLGYIRVPLLIKFFLSQEDDEFFIELGPEFGFLISEKYELNNSKDFKSKSFDFAPVLGLGYSIGRNLDIDFRCAYGVTDILKTKSDIHDSRDANAKNLNVIFSLGLGYFF